MVQQVSIVQSDTDWCYGSHDGESGSFVVVACRGTWQIARHGQKIAHDPTVTVISSGHIWRSYCVFPREG